MLRIQSVLPATIASFAITANALGQYAYNNGNAELNAWSFFPILASSAQLAPQDLIEDFRVGGNGVVTGFEVNLRGNSNMREFLQSPGPNPVFRRCYWTIRSSNGDMPGAVIASSFDSIPYYISQETTTFNGFGNGQSRLHWGIFGWAPGTNFRLGVNFTEPLQLIPGETYWLSYMFRATDPLYINYLHPLYAGPNNSLPAYYLNGNTGNIVQYGLAGGPGGQFESDFKIIPTASSAALLGMAAITAANRRRR